MLGGIPRRWVHVCIAKRNLLDISEIYAARLRIYQPSSLCLPNGVVEDRRFLRLVSEVITVSHESYLTTFVKGSPPRNGSNHVKTGVFLIPSKWGCGGQNVPDGGPITWCRSEGWF